MSRELDTDFVIFRVRIIVSIKNEALSVLSYTSALFIIVFTSLIERLFV